MTTLFIDITSQDNLPKSKLFQFLDNVSYRDILYTYNMNYKHLTLRSLE